MPVGGGALFESAGVVGRLRAAVAEALAPHDGVVLAVSGGRDSVALLDAALAVARGRVCLVATFDHGTGPDAARAAEHVRGLARAAGVPCRVGRGRGAPATEAGWRTARWRFLRRAARRSAAGGAGTPPVVATAHTADDQLETVVMRLLRGAGARGLAAMLATPAGVVRPLLDVAAADVAAYADARGLAWVDDPSNASRRHLRNRVRHELLPALLRVRPGLGGELAAAARAAADCRARLDAVAATLAARCAGAAASPAGGLWLCGPGGVPDGEPVASLADLRAMTPAALAALWPAMAARRGVRLDRRATARASAFTTACLARVAAGRAAPGEAQLAGGARLALVRAEAAGAPAWRLVLRRRPAPTAARAATPVALDAAGAPDGVRFGCWRLRRLDRPPTAAECEGGCVAWLEAGRDYAVRAWRPGDRWTAPGAGAARRVKRFLADRRVPAEARAGWPVVVAGTSAGGVAGDEARSCGAPAAAGASGAQIVWVPGVRRSSAAPARPGQPGFHLLCERTPDRRRVRG